MSGARIDDAVDFTATNLVQRNIAALGPNDIDVVR
jgi:hypothetical protein